MAKDAKTKKGGLLQRLRSTKQPKADPELAALLDEVQDDPTNMRARKKLADYYLKKDDKVRALDQYLTVAETYAEKGFYPKAVAVYKQALNIDPNMIEVYLKLATLYHKLGLMPEVVEQYQKAAGIYERQGKDREALDIRRMLLDLDPTNVVGRLKLGQRYLEKGFNQEAVNEFLRAADIFENQGKTAELQKLLEGVLDRGVENFDVLYRLVELYREQGKPELALARLAKLTGELAGSSSTLEMTAELAIELGKPAVAAKALERAAGLYGQINRQDKVQEVCCRILEIDPENEWAAANVSAEPAAAPAPVEAVAEEPVLEEEIAVEEMPEEEVAIEEEIAVEELPEEEIAIEEEIALEEEISVEELPEEVTIEELPEEEIAVEEIAIEELPEEEIAVEEIPEEEIAVEEIEVEEIPEEEIAVEEIAVEEIPEEEIELEEEISVEEISEEEIAVEEIEVEEEEEYEEIVSEEEITEVEEPMAEGEAEAAEIEELPVEGELEIEEVTAEAEPVVEEVAEEEEEPEALDLGEMSEEEAAQRLDEAIDIYLKYNLRDKAIEYLEMALERNPDSLAIIEKMMTVYHDGGEREKAGELLNKLIDLAQGQGRADKLENYLSQLVEFEPEDLEAALRLAEHYVDSEPERAVVHFFDVANRYREQEQFDDAERILARVLELDPSNEGAYQELLDIYEQTGQTDKAIGQLYQLADSSREFGDTLSAEGYLQRVLELAPMETTAHEKLLDLYEQSGENEKLAVLLGKLADRHQSAGEMETAQGYYERLLTLQPDDLTTREKLKDLLLDTEQNDAAIEQLFTMAGIAGDRNDQQYAIDALHEVLVLDGDNLAAHEQLRDLFLAQGDNDGAIGEIMTLAKVALDNEDVDGALAQLDQILSIDPRHEATRRRKISILRDHGRGADAVTELFGVARAMERGGQLDKAEAALNEILTIDADSARAHEALKDLYLQSGQSEKALGELMKLAENAEKQGDNATALNYLGEICGLDRDNIDARRAIARMYLADDNVSSAVSEMLAVADILARGADNDAAIETLRQALSYDEANEVAIERLVALYLAENDVDHAVELLLDAGDRAKENGRLTQAGVYFAQIVEAAPDNTTGRERFKETLLDTGRNAEAIEQMFALADLYAQAGETTLVEETYRDILGVDPMRRDASLALKDHYLNIGRLEAAMDILYSFVGLERAEGNLDEAKAFAQEMLVISEEDRRALLAMTEIAVQTGDAAAGADGYLKLAAMSERDGQADDAESFYGRVLELDQANVTAHEKIKQLLIDRGDESGAIEHIFALADLAVREGDTARAEACYREVLTLDENNEPALEQLVSLFVAAGEGEKAIPEMFGLARSANTKDDYAKAEKYLNQILDLDPENTQAIELLSQVHINAGDTGQAVSELFTLEAAADAKGDYEGALELVGRILELEPDNLSALNKKADLEEVLEREGQVLETLLILARVQQERNLWEDSERTLRRVIKLDKQNQTAHERLVDLLQREENKRGVIDELLRFNAPVLESEDDEAIVDLANRILALDTKFERAHRLLVDAYKRQGDTAGAIDELFVLADLAEQDGRAANAETLYKEILAIDDTNVIAVEKLTAIFTDSDRADEAVRLQLNYGDALQVGDEGAAAREAYEHALQLDAQNEDALRKLKESYLEEADLAEAVEVLFRSIEVFDAKGQDAKAVAALEEILDHDERNEKALAELKERYLAAGQTDKAVEMLFAADKQMGDQWDDARRIANMEDVLGMQAGNEHALRRIMELQESAGETEQVMASMLRLAEMHAAAGDQEALEKDYRQILSRDAEHTEARRHLCDLYRERGDVEALSAELFALADQLRRRSEFVDAQQALMDIVDAGVHKERALQQLADLYGAMGDAEKQREARYDLATNARQSGDTGAAEDIYLEILREDPEDVLAREQLIDLYAEHERGGEAAQQALILADKARKAGDVETAIERYNQVLLYDPSQTKARARLKKLFLQTERTDEAVQQLRALADAAQEAGEFEAVEDSLREMLQYQPDNNNVRNELIALYENTEQNDKAVIELLAMSDRIAEAGQADEALALVERAVQLQPDSEAAQNRLKDAYVHAGETAKAIDSLFRLYEIEVRANRRHSAEKALREILSLDPSNTEAKEKVFDLFKLGATVEEQIADLLAQAEEATTLGDRQTAEEVLNHVLSIDPEQAEARVRLKSLYAEPVAAPGPVVEHPASVEAEAAEAEAGVFEELDLTKSATGIEEDIAIDWGEPDAVDQMVDADKLRVDAAVEVDVFDEVGEEEVESVDVFGEMPGERATEPEAVDVFAADEAAIEDEAVGEEEEVLAEAEPEVEVELFSEPAPASEEEEIAAEPEPAVEEDLFAEAAPEEAEAAPVIEEDLFAEAAPEEVEAEPVIEEDLFAEAEPIAEAEEIVAEAEAEPVEGFEKAAADLFAKAERIEPVEAEEGVKMARTAAVMFDSIEVSSEDFMETGEVPVKPIKEKAEVESRILEEFREPDTTAPSVKAEEGLADLLGDLGLESEAAPIEEPAAEEGMGDLMDDIFGKVEKPAAAAGDSLDDLIGGLTEEAPAEGEAVDDIFQSFVDSLGDQARGGTTQSHYELGIAFREMDSIEEAIAEYEKALALDSGDLAFEINYELGQCYVSLNKYDMATEYLESALSEGTDDEQAMLDLTFDLAVCLKQIGELNEAKEYFVKVDAKSSNYRGAKAEIAECEKGKKKGKKKKKGDDDDNIGFL
ncbi:MAG TPA: tetratricopeptide repeat protein [bacterium]|nr:tetratricopeptide repeat protein [bacterium]